MFWGIVLKANKKYSQKTVKSFHVSQAVLDHTSSSGGPNQIYVTYENSKYLIATLENNKCQQVALDLNFAAGQEVSFQSVGNGCIHLTGYLTEIPEMSDFSDEEEEESDVENEIVKESKKNGMKEKSKKKGSEKVKNEDDEDDDDDDSDQNDIDSSMDGLEMEEDAEDDSDEQDELEDDEDEAESDDDSDEEVQQPKTKQIKLDKAAVKQQQNGVAEKDSKKDKKNKKDKKQANAEKQQNNTGEKTLAGGVKVHDIVVGSGPEVKAGKKVQVYYEGRLKQNNKVFDSVKQGAGFKFHVGRGDVIKGWDVGVVGMKVGGKRRITCPPHMAYGARGMPPQIPPNSTLVFEVEVKGV